MHRAEPARVCGFSYANILLFAEERGVAITHQEAQRTLLSLRSAIEDAQTWAGIRVIVDAMDKRFGEPTEKG